MKELFLLASDTSRNDLVNFKRHGLPVYWFCNSLIVLRVPPCPMRLCASMIKSVLSEGHENNFLSPSTSFSRVPSLTVVSVLNLYYGLYFSAFLIKAYRIKK